MASLMQEASKFRDLYVAEKEKLLDVESDLKDCKVIRTSVNLLSKLLMLSMRFFLKFYKYLWSRET